MLFLLNTFLGFLAAQLYDVFTRDKNSINTPEKFDLIFFIKDTWQKIVVSLFLSVTLSLLVWLNVEDFAMLLGKDWTVLNNLVYAFIGFAPEVALQFIRKRYGLLRSNRKDV